MRFSLLFIAVSFLGAALAAKTIARKVNSGPTGYVIDFVFTPNATTHPKSVQLGFPLFSDSLHASPSVVNGYLPYDWRPEYFSMEIFSSALPVPVAGLNMTFNSRSGDWEITVPFPSGTFNYNFYLDCNDTNYFKCPAAVTDPSNPLIELYPGDQFVSVIQVPFKKKYQHYPSPGSTYPSPGVHDVGSYLLAEYGTILGKKYPVLYLSHGGGGSDSDWLNQGRPQYPRPPHQLWRSRTNNRGDAKLL
ncbi:uncharacterized protein PAC_09715 [Phialocephala subalpina]|uniref:Uncharacterized protein n=1 Tax=Phialocephala subalpina TaxID=576137 RepID=A0A1L7X478_9HELO|nr:uncharacterized protein PAC_09715 [Phialocephala subalpina]